MSTITETLANLVGVGDAILSQEEPAFVVADFTFDASTGVITFTNPEGQWLAIHWLERVTIQRG